MKLHNLRIQNYRCFLDETVYFNDYNCLVGPNGSGKSTVLMALNVFFRNTEAPTSVVTLSEEDFHNRDTSKPIEITATFCDLNEDAKEDLKAYVRQESLVVISRAVWDTDSVSAEVHQLGSRSVIRDFAMYFEAEEEKASAADLKSIFNDLRHAYPDVVAASTKEAMRSALREYEESHPELCESLESNNQFYGWSRGSNLIGRYLQWVYIPAVKDPSVEQDEQKHSALGKLLQRSIRSQIDFAGPVSELRREAAEKYQELLRAQNEVLNSLGMAIQERLRLWAHSGARVELNWHFDENKSVSISDPFARASVGEGEFLGEIARAGHGFQRSFLLALLQVLAESDDGTSPTLILGFEEPELYQHPPQARHLASVLEELASQGAQVVLTTHSPYFVSSKGYEAIRLFRIPKGQSACMVNATRYQELAETLSAALGEPVQTRSELIAAVEQIMQPSQNELFFCKLPILVEGSEDVAFIATWLQYHGHWQEFRRLGCHFVICEGKTNMSRPLAIANLLKLPSFVIFDGDCDKAIDDQRKNHFRDNKCLLSLAGEESEPIIDECFFGGRTVMWRTRIMDVIRDEIGAEVWEHAENDVRSSQRMQGVKRKNPILVAATLEKLFTDGVNIPRLDRLGALLLHYANAVNAT